MDTFWRLAQLKRELDSLGFLLVTEQSRDMREMKVVIHAWIVEGSDTFTKFTPEQRFAAYDSDVVWQKVVEWLDRQVVELRNWK